MSVPEAGGLATAMAALRREHPEARILSELVSVPGEHAVVRVTVELPGHGSASTLGSAEAVESPRCIELAEDRALLRALRWLGYGIEELPATYQPVISATPAHSPVVHEYAGRGETTVSPPSAPWDEPAHRAATRVAERHESADRDPQVVEREQGSAAGGRRDALSARRAQGAGSSATRPTTAPRRAGQESHAALPADFGWDAFWRWARPLGFTRKEQVAEALGRPLAEIQELSPRELRAALETHLPEGEERARRG